MYSPATTHTTPCTTPAITPATTPAKPHHRHEHDVIRDHLPTKPPVLTRDFYLDTFFNPVWTSGPHVFSFAEDGTVVRPETYSLEPYPGYSHARGAQHLESVDASHFQSFSAGEEKPWKNVAITEQDDADFAAILAGVRGEQRGNPYRHAEYTMPNEEEPELVYTWPPMPRER